MRMVAAVAVLSVVLVALAGCSGKGSGSGTSSSTSHSASASRTTSSSSSSSSSGTTSSSSSSSTTGAANHAPTGAISVVVNGTMARFNLTGADQDQDTLVWDLAFGDGNRTNGTSLPATASHNYTKAGNLTAQYTVTDGKDSVTYNVTVHLTAGAGGATTQDESGSTTASAAGCGPGILGLAGHGQPYQGGPAEGVEWIKFDVAPGTVGKDFTWSESAAISPANAGSFVTFYDATSAYINEDFSGAGTVPPAAAFAVFYACGPGPDSFTYHAG